ncbi:hypothetical protein IEO21_03421 [Rhodonia placenta]|uniref:Methyltransferase ausD n=1 Tax=Rhodonia placenta TaxID=104341 RepID=A0A8H7P5X1_9APHY|nr:hypothetical protein IEO21_03421 [Postia placenta]
MSDNAEIPLLDGKHYALDGEELAFFKSQTGIQDEHALKAHIMKVQTEAYKVHRYSCIFRFNFIKLKISRLPAYDQLLKLGQERDGAIFMDIGCCFGNDVRKAVADGFPVQNAIASDLHPEFWDLGHKLFNTTPATFPVPFVAGDALSATFLPPTPPLVALPTSPAPALASVTTLGQLLGHVSSVHASSFFHLFDEAHQAQLARALAGLLSPAPGSLIFGAHGGRSSKGLRRVRERVGEKGWRTEPMFCHSPESWRALWDGEVFPPGTVRVEASLQQRRDGASAEVDEEGAWAGILVWSVTRV